MALLAAASQRGLPLVVLSPMALWILMKHLKSDRLATEGGQGLFVVAVEEHHPVGGLARQAQELSSGSDHRHFERRGPGARVYITCRHRKARVGKKSEHWRPF